MRAPSFACASLFIHAALAAAGAPEDGSSGGKGAGEEGPLLDAIAGAMRPSERGPFLDAAASFGRGLEAALSPILAALPRDGSGRFGAPAVRYALHHAFVREHGWRLKGLDPSGEAWNATSPSSATALERMPAAVRALIRRRLDGPGLGAQDVAAFAVALKYLIRDEARERLRIVYTALGADESTTADSQQAAQLVDAVTASYILNEDLKSHRSRWTVKEALPRMAEEWPDWNVSYLPMQKKVLDSRMALLAPSRREAMSFAEVADALGEVVERFGGTQVLGCTSLKGKLMAMEYQGTGRVRLAAFYSASLSGHWQFSESQGYLKTLGALDTTNPQEPVVIIPNYIGGQSNCVGASRYHDTCCVSECEALLAQLERVLHAPAAAPEHIAAAIEDIPSSTVPRGRRVDTLLRHRLQAIAAGHAGQVPVSGRLFAQWMHFAYPRECPYPHIAGETKQVNLFDWGRSQGGFTATRDEMLHIASQTSRKGGPVLGGRWVHAEELLAPPETRPLGLVTFHTASAVVALAVMTLGVASRAARAARAARLAWRGGGAKPGLDV